MAILHPVIIFSANLALNKSELIGPLTNQTSQGVNHPDDFVSENTNTSLKAARARSRSTSIDASPSGLIKTYDYSLENYVDKKDGVNRLKHFDYFILQGQEALCVRKTYCSSTYGGSASDDSATLTSYVLTPAEVDSFIERGLIS